MKSFILGIAIAAALMAGLRASDTEGLFVAGDEHKLQGLELKDGKPALPFKMVRLQLTRAVLRTDTDDKTRYWLEIDIVREGAARNPDPGDFYLFRIDGKDYTGFSTRGRINEAGWRWAVGMKDVAAGRVLLAKIAKAYALPERQVEDQTKAGR
ncbi:MAG: hypothetical protein ACO1TE_20910 [Prosthecobacter sp.]